MIFQLLNLYTHVIEGYSENICDFPNGYMYILELQKYCCCKIICTQVVAIATGS